MGDGFHRHVAHQWAERKTILTVPNPGGLREAILYSCSANATHGLRRLNADKRREEDVRHTETLYPMVRDAIQQGIYLPNRGSLLCSRRHCAFWRACEREFGGKVRES